MIEAARCAMMVSGSVSLELMARRTPAAVVYRVGRFLHSVGKCVIGVDSLTLPNLMSRRKVFPETVSVGNPQPAVEFLTESVGAMLGDEFYYQKDGLAVGWSFAASTPMREHQRRAANGSRSDWEWTTPALRRDEQPSAGYCISGRTLAPGLRMYLSKRVGNRTQTGGG